jgi:hypothetical protein
VQALAVSMMVSALVLEHYMMVVVQVLELA